MTQRGIAFITAALAVLAICTDARPESLDSMTNGTLRAYTETQIELGAPSLPVTSRALCHEARGLLREGKKDAAAAKLELAASLTGDDAAPLFALARIKVLSADPAFARYFLEGARRIVASYPSQAIAAADLAAFLVLALVAALVALLVAFLVKYWQFLNHKIVEVYGRRHPFPPARWIVGFACLALLLMKLGPVLYAAILIPVLWVFLSRREKAAVAAFVVLISAASFMARSSNALAPALDPGSVTSRLSLVNTRGVDGTRIARIRAIPDGEFKAEKSFALGTMMYRFGAYDEARASLLESVSLRPGDASAFINLGNVYFMQGDFDRALAGYRSAVELDSTNAVAHFNIGQTYIKKMLFAQSGDWLERATVLGIDAYRAAHPGLGLRNPPVYEQGFPAARLWATAAAEGKGRTGVLIDEMLRPYLLFPFPLVWALFTLSLIGAFVSVRRVPVAWNVRRCDNCGGAVCSCCEDTRTGIRLCRECASVTRGLTSIRIMEAILRTRRQKLASGPEKPRLAAIMLFPGFSHIRYDRLTRGVALVTWAAGAVVLLVWRGGFFGDPRATGLAGSLGGAVPPLLALAAGYVLALRARPPLELRSHHVFPAEIRREELEKDAASERDAAAPAGDPWKGEKSDAATGVSPKPSFDGDAPAPGPARRERVASGVIEKGSKWH